MRNPNFERVRVGTDWIRQLRFCTIAVRFDAGCFQLFGLKAMLAVGWLALILAAFGIPAAAEGGTPGGNASPLAATQERRAARGWLELEQDQRAYRSRVAPLDLKQQRQLETIERSQRLDLRAIQQRDAREVDRRERQQRLQPRSNLDAHSVPRRDAAADSRRRAERHRATIRSQQQGLPFSRR